MQGFGYFISHVLRPGRSRLVASLKRWGGGGGGGGPNRSSFNVTGS